jgi:hypothetical protein
VGLANAASAAGGTAALTFVFLVILHHCKALVVSFFYLLCVALYFVHDLSNIGDGFMEFLDERVLRRCLDELHFALFRSIVCF